VESLYGFFPGLTKPVEHKPEEFGDISQNRYIFKSRFLGVRHDNGEK